MKLPQMSIRDLFWLLLAYVLAVGWWIEWPGHQRDAERLEQTKVLAAALRDANEYLEQAAIQQPTPELEYSGFLVEVVNDQASSTADAAEIDRATRLPFPSSPTRRQTRRNSRPLPRT